MIGSRYNEIPGIPWSFPAGGGKFAVFGQILQNSTLFGKKTLLNSLPQGILAIGIGHKKNGGLNPLCQIGGPRSIQFALKLQF